MGSFTVILGIGEGYLRSGDVDVRCFSVSMLEWLRTEDLEVSLSVGIRSIVYVRFLGTVGEASLSTSVSSFSKLIRRRTSSTNFPQKLSELTVDSAVE